MAMEIVDLASYKMVMFHSFFVCLPEGTRSTGMFFEGRQSWKSGSANLQLLPLYPNMSESSKGDGKSSINYNKKQLGIQN
jgi:hypothetical protein